MEMDIFGWLGNLAGQLPLLIVYCIGLIIGVQRSAQQPQAARRVLLAFGLLLVDALVLSGVSFWLLGYFSRAALGLTEMSQLLFWLALGRSLLHAIALWLLLRTIFPALVSQPPRWVSRLIGALVGISIGVLLAILFGDFIGAALGVTTFEGARGYFVIFLLLPLSAVVGGITGVILAGLIRRPARDTP